ncbi:MAG: helix-turn-helix domain-containing protein [Mycolicibacterium insubricum]|nr:helix-turn-helix domain-containing protein [Mycobacterium sp.]
MSTITAERQYLSVPETSQILGLHPHTVRSLIREGKLPAIRLGRHFRIPRAALTC